MIATLSSEEFAVVYLISYKIIQSPKQFLNLLSTLVVGKNQD